MLDGSAPACRGVAPPVFLVLLAALATVATGAGAQGLPDSPLPRGAASPPLVLDSLDHGSQSLAALHGRVVLVHFFATWCEPCRDEMSALSRLAARMADHPFTILTVDVAEPVTRVRRFFTQEFGEAPVPFPVLLDERRVATKAWKVEYLPATYVLDRDHLLRLYAAGPVDWDDVAANAALDRILSGTAVEGSAPVLPALPDNSGSNAQ